MSEHTKLLGLADALMVNLTLKGGEFGQQQVPIFEAKGTPLQYRLRLVTGFYAPDYKTATLLFHVAGNAHLLAEQDSDTLTFSLLNIPVDDERVIDGITAESWKTSLGLRQACGPYKVKKLGNRAV